MTAIRGSEDDREAIPRWRSFNRTVSRGELRAIDVPSVFRESDDIPTLRRTFEQNPSIFSAADLFGVLISQRTEDEETRKLANFLLADDDSPTLLSKAAFTHLSPTPKTANSLRTDRTLVELASSSVGRLRRSLKEGPRNPVRWVDLSLAFATLGSRKKADRAMRVALELAPDNRFVLRSASRLFVYLDDPQRANFILNGSERTKVDPWLLAAELSTAALAFERIPRLQEARELLATENFSPFASSELASEIATDEVRHGRDRRAKQMISIALVDPTENAVAQAESLVRRAQIRIRSDAMGIEGGFEARASSNATAGNWDAAAKEAELWLFDQPFAIEPAVFATFSSAISGTNLPRALELAQFGLRVHPDDRTLLNNTAFIMASLDQPVSAREIFGQIKDGDETPQGLAVEQATIGLIEFREGKAHLGRQRYASAFDSLVKIGNRELAAMTAIYWAAEEHRAESDQRAVATRRALEQTNHLGRPDVSAVFNRLLGGITSTRPR